MSDAWIEIARDVARRAREAPAGWQVIRGERPAVLDQEGIRALAAPLVAAIAWAGAIFREMVAGTPIDPLALLMRLIALAMTVRVLLLGRALVERVAAWAGAGRSTLVLAPEGLWAQLPDETVSAEKAEILGISERGTWQARGAGRRFSPVYVVVASPLRAHIELPPIFDATPGVLAERLMRWRGAIELPESPRFPEPAALASKVYEDAARGIRDPGTIVIRHGRGWMRRGPWATVLLGVAILEGFARSSPAEQAAIGPVSIFAASIALVMVPLVWILWQRRSMAPQLGLAMVLTSAELLMRTRGGVLRVRWPNLQRLTIDSRGRFSIIEGWALRRSLVIKRKEGLPITYDEAFLGVPAEVALELFEAHARGAMLPSGGEKAVELPEPGAESGAEGEHGREREPRDP